MDWEFGVVVIHSLSHVQDFSTSWTVALQAPLSFTISQSLLRFMSTEPEMLSNHLIFCRSLLPSVFPRIRIFSNELALCIRRPNYWSFSFSISSSNEHSGLISFRFGLLAVEETPKSLLQHHSLKASVLQHSALYMVQFSQLYVTTRKTIVLTIWNFFRVRQNFFLMFAQTGFFLLV